MSLAVCKALRGGDIAVSLLKRLTRRFQSIFGRISGDQGLADIAVFLGQHIDRRSSMGREQCVLRPHELLIVFLERRVGVGGNLGVRLCCTCPLFARDGGRMRRLQRFLGGIERGFRFDCADMRPVQLLLRLVSCGLQLFDGVVDGRQCPRSLLKRSHRAVGKRISTPRRRKR